MRFLLFETYKFPNAEVTAKLDMASLQALRTTTRISYPLNSSSRCMGSLGDRNPGT